MINLEDGASALGLPTFNLWILRDLLNQNKEGLRGSVIAAAWG